MAALFSGGCSSDNPFISVEAKRDRLSGFFYSFVEKAVEKRAVPDVF